MDRRETIASIFGVPRALVGMVHLEALPGTPGCRLSVAEIREQAVATARTLREAGFHGLILENMHDRPYLNRSVGPEIVATMARVAGEVRAAVSLPLGVQVLAGANQEALAVALASGAAFVRVEGFVFAQAGDEGMMQADAGALLRYRRAIGAESIRIFADVKKKHAAHAITADVDLVETARAAQFFLADAVVVTGSSTGRAAAPSEVRAVSEALKIPTLVGSGITPENLPRYAAADALIVGSALKRDSLWSNPLEARRVDAVVRAFEALPAARPTP